MRRSKPKRRDRPLRRTKALDPGRPLDRKAALRPGRPPRRRPRRQVARELSEAWAKGVQGKPCAVCGSRRDVQGHHVLKQQHIRSVAATLRIDFDALQSILWDERNRLPVCDPCHDAHHDARRRIPLAVVRRECPKVVQFARELDRRGTDAGVHLGVVARLERDYET